MHSILLVLFALLAISNVLAAPVHQRHRRGSCKSRSSSVSASVPVATSSAVSSTHSISASATSVPENVAVPTPTPVASSSSSSKSKSHSSSSSSTSSSTAPKASSSPSTSKSVSSALFPAGDLAGSSSSSWSTSASISNALPLSDATLRPTDILSSLTHNYVTAPDGELSMEVDYPKGTVALSGADGPAGGVSFYAPGPASVDLTTAKEVTFGYSVLFQEGFQFNQGGKLPGLYGGDDPEGSITCSGGSKRTDCFSARFMWRTNGAGELYTYLPPGFAANQAQCNVPPFSTCNDAFGASVGRGALSFTPGTRATISQRVRLNDAGQSNGQIEVFFNGKSVINLDGVVLRDSDAGRIRGIQMQSFFGGHTEDWASPQDQKTWFSDFSMAITETL